MYLYLSYTYFTYAFFVYVYSLIWIFFSCFIVRSTYVFAYFVSLFFFVPIFSVRFDSCCSTVDLFGFFLSNTQESCVSLY
jgi:hypothetical protein